MGLAEAANLVINLKLNDQASRAIAGVKGNVDKLGGSFGKIGGLAKQGLSSAISNLAKLGTLAAGAAFSIGGLALKSGLESLATLEDATTSVTGAIEQMGLTGKVTAQQVAQWANQIESDVGAAFDDKDITQATTTLIRFGHIVPENIKPAMVVMTDLATKTGDVDSAASLLAKALADPTNAAGKLARAGVILTDQQQEQIKALTAAGDAAGAQKVVLDALTESTKGAAAASQGPYRRAINTLKDTWEDVTRALAIGFLPVIEKVAGYLKGKMADPSFLKKVQDFGEKLAGFLDKGLEAAKKIPWDTIANSMKLAGEGAKAAYDLFMGLPEWVKEAVITGWGLNKLTGGALGSIVGELGKGLIKGVLGMTAGVVNIKAGVVNGGGGTPTPGGGGLSDLVKNAVQFISLVAIAGVVQQALHDFFHVPGGTMFSPAASQSDIQQYNASHPNTTVGTAGFIAAIGGDPNKAVPVTVTNMPNGPGSTTGFDPKYAAASQLSAMGQIKEHIDSERAENDAAYGQMNSSLSVMRQSFVEKLGAAVTQLRALGEKGDQLRRDLAEKLGISVSKLVELRHAVTGDMASKLGISIGELRAIKRQADYDDAKIAAKLGISVEQLQAIRDKARETASNTLGIKNKDWSPTIKNNITITNKFAVSGRELQRAVTHYQLVNGGKTVD